MKKIILMCTVPLMLTACTMTPEECDPKITDPGMLDKLGCVVSGSYSQRSEQKNRKFMIWLRNSMNYQKELLL